MPLVPQPQKTPFLDAYSLAGSAEVYVMNIQNDSTSSQAPNPSPYPIQRNLTQAMHEDAFKLSTLWSMQAWTGQSAKLALAMPTKDIVVKLWNEIQSLLN